MVAGSVSQYDLFRYMKGKHVSFAACSAIFAGFFLGDSPYTLSVQNNILHEFERANISVCVHVPLRYMTYLAIFELSIRRLLRLVPSSTIFLGAIRLQPYLYSMIYYRGLKEVT